MSSRSYFEFSGPAYPQVLRGDNPTSEVRADLDDRNQFYYDSAVQLSEKDLERFVTLDGKPLCYEHDEDDEIGYIHHAWVDSSRKLRIIGRIYTDSARGQQIAANVRAGHFRGLSVGYSTGIERDGKSGKSMLKNKNFKEISLCREPFFTGCDISVTASKNGGKDQATKERLYMSNTHHTLKVEKYWIPLDVMASTQEQTTDAAQLTPNQVAHSEASELLKEADKLKEQLTDTKAKLEAKTEAELAKEKEMKLKLERLAYLEQKEAAEKERYAKEQQAVVDEVIQEQAAAYGGELPKDWVESTRATLTNPDFKEYAGIITASAMKSKAERERANKIEAQLKEMQERMARIEAENTEAARRVRASRADLADATKPQQLKTETNEEEKDELKMSSTTTTSTYEIVCAKPSAAELPIFKELGFVTEQGVRAGSGAHGRQLMTTYHEPAVHAHLADERGEKWLPNSMRYSNPTLFSWLTDREAPAISQTKMVKEKSSVQFGDPEQFGLR
jgi:hypothetical protein